jgi:hypothetical protein
MATARAPQRVQLRERGRRPRVAFLAELHCECGRPDCRATIPAGAGVYRRRPEQFIVVPDHLAGETVVAAADKFFVVEGRVRSSL